MKARPIIFSGPMVWALMDGRKNQTRRPVKPQPPAGCVYSINGSRNAALCHESGPVDAETIWVPPTPTSKDHRLACPYGQPGDLLYVRETSLPDFPKAFSYYDWSWAEVPEEYRTPEHVLYRATWDGFDINWHPSIHMPRWASRITLYLTDVRVERVQEINEQDAFWEGTGYLDREGISHHAGGHPSYSIGAFRELWDSLNAKRGFSWHDNPWVWVLTFSEILANVDQVLAEPEVYIPERPEAMA